MYTFSCPPCMSTLNNLGWLGCTCALERSSWDCTGSLYQLDGCKWQQTWHDSSCGRSCPRLVIMYSCTGRQYICQDGKCLFSTSCLRVIYRVVNHCNLASVSLGTQMHIPVPEVLGDYCWIVQMDHLLLFIFFSWNLLTRLKFNHTTLNECNWPNKTKWTIRSTVFWHPTTLVQENGSWYQIVLYWLVWYTIYQMFVLTPDGKYYAGPLISAPAHIYRSLWFLLSLAKN